MNLTTLKWSISDWHKLIESGILDDKNVEFLEGEIISMAPEGIPHSATNREIDEYLRELLKDRAYISQAHPITLINSEPEPDIAILHLPKQNYRTRHPHAEDIYWLIEVSQTTLNFDLTNKAQIYAQNGIAEYWVIDLNNKQVIVHTQPVNNQYQKVKKFKTGSINPIAFPDLEVNLNQLLIY